MKTTSENKLNLKLFYKELGQLLYAVAMADGKIRKQEFEAMDKFIYEELLPTEFEFDSSGMNKAFYSEFEFEKMVDEKLPAQLVFDNYLTYLKSNAPFLTDKHKSSIINAVVRVADAYKNVNQKEEEMINLLKSEINNL